jgi:beta-lactamase regulating signal transducer with metallopeptidase domain
MSLLMLKATLVFLAGGLAALCLHRRSAALRHLVWTVTLAAAIVLAFATPVLPDIAVSTPGWPVTATTEPVLPPDFLVQPAEDARDEPIEAGRTSAPSRPSVSTVDIRVLIWIWLAGVMAILSWCLLGRLGLARLLRRAERFDDPAWQADLEDARAPKHLRLFVSPAIGSPATWGLFRPVIVLPPAARDWTADRRRVVLAHELAHVARGDGVANLIGWLACALYWPNPLAWIAARRLRAEAERAADDRVLAQGVPPEEYAAHLLDVARGSRVMRLLGASAIGMARPSSLEGRLLAVLDETANRNAPRATTRRASWTACAGLVLPIAMLTPSAEPAPAEQAEPFVQSDTTLESSYPARPGEKLTLTLKTGGSVEIIGWDEPTVRIRAWMRGPSRRSTTVEIWHRGPGIRLHTDQTETRGSSSTNHRFEIRVPRRYDVDIESAGGGLTIIGVEGEFSGHSGGGRLTLERAKGRATLETGGGDIDVTDSDLDGQVSTGGGMVRLNRVSGSLRGSSGSGPVMRIGERENEKGDLTGIEARGDRITVTGRGARTPGTLHIDKAGGSVDLERAPDGADVRTGGGSIHVGEAARLVKASTGGGDITIGPVDGSIEATSGAGTLRATVVSDDASVKFTTGKGSAIITLPRGFNGRFELETAYTRGNPRTRIETDWDLSESEIDEWDSSEGSPRKYVRASGRAGNGPGVIRIAIVNGDITIRRAR